jgi:hypothetical protein
VACFWQVLVLMVPPLNTGCNSEFLSEGLSASQPARHSSCLMGSGLIKRANHSVSKCIGQPPARWPSHGICLSSSRLYKI